MIDKNLTSRGYSSRIQVVYRITVRCLCQKIRVTAIKRMTAINYVLVSRQYPGHILLTGVPYASL